MVYFSLSFDFLRPQELTFSKFFLYLERNLVPLQ